jgi:hypothetical protein
MADIQVTNTDADLSDNTLLTEENAYTITGLHTFSRSTNAPFAVNSGAAVVANLDADKLDGIEATGFVKANGSVALTANWDAGAYEIRAQTLEADVSTGTAPLTIASTTKVDNLNADKLDDQEGTYYLDPGNLSSAVAVNKGGTGATSLTDGGVLLGSGTSAITATAVLGDGVILIGDGTTDPTTLDVGSSTAITTLGTIGVGTGDSPTFTAVTVGQADITAEGDLRLQDASGGEYVGLDAPATVSSSYTLTLPAAIGSVNQMLTINNTDGTLQWASASSTSAAGSDTQVQYNDGGTNFGGDAGLVYNDSTDLLTSGKLATTDTSATSIDVAGGITAGTGNVAIVNAAGKIPALSSTYLASLDGSALTGISAGAWTTYATTVTDLVNSTTDTTVLTSTAIGAGDFTLGSVLIIWCTYTVNNQTGGNQTVQLSLGLEESGTYRSHQSNHTWEAPAATRQQSMQFIFQRKDADEIHISVGSESIGHVGSQFGNPGNGNCKSAGSLDFSNACTPIVKVKFATASASLGIDMHSGMVALITAGT